jgi:hypothetical protein
MDESIRERLKRIEALIGPSETEFSRRLDTTTEALWKAIADRGAGTAERRSALAILAERSKGEPEFSEVLNDLLDDPDPEIVAAAIAACPPFDGRLIARIRTLLDDPRSAIWMASARALARRKDRAIGSKLLDWAVQGDRAHRREGLAALGFLLLPQEMRAIVAALIERGPRDEEDEAMLVEALALAEERLASWGRVRGESEE